MNLVLAAALIVITTLVVTKHHRPLFFIELQLVVLNRVQTMDALSLLFKPPLNRTCNRRIFVMKQSLFKRFLAKVTLLATLTLLACSSSLAITIDQQPLLVAKPVPGNMAIVGSFEFPTMLTRRSEEHTSELQSRPHLVCRLLLEKKKKNTIYNHNVSTDIYRCH